MLIDYHIHNHFSADSESDTEEIIKLAMKRDVKAICITNHTEWFIEGKGIPGAFEYKTAMKRFKSAEIEINDLRKKFPDIQIGFGAEVQFQKEYLNNLKLFIKSNNFDFVLGSIHIVDGILISGGGHAGELFEKMDEEKAYTKYFKEMIKLIQWGNFDAMAHFDVIKKYGHEHYGPFQPKKYKPIILEILQMMKDKGIGIELNTGSLHKRCKELFPHPDILKWCVEVGIEHYTLGSDSHDLELVSKYIPEAFKIAKKVGIKTLSTYEKRKPTKYKI